MFESESLSQFDVDYHEPSMVSTRSQTAHRADQIDSSIIRSSDSGIMVCVATLTTCSARRNNRHNNGMRYCTGYQYYVVAGRCTGWLSLTFSGCV